MTVAYLHPDKVYGVTRVLSRGRQRTQGKEVGSNLIAALAQRLAIEYARRPR